MTYYITCNPLTKLFLLNCLEKSRKLGWKDTVIIKFVPTMCKKGQFAINIELLCHPVGEEFEIGNKTINLQSSINTN